MSDAELSPEQLMDVLFEEAVNEGAPEQIVETRGFDARTFGLDEDEKKKVAGGFWLEEPVTFNEFVVSKEHMAQPPLSPRQRRAVEDFLGTDPKRLFMHPETLYRIGVFLWGKGGGKDWLCSLIQSYVIYVLLCMRDPRKTLGMPIGEPIDIINVAYSADQAKDVFFVKFSGRLKHWKWLARRFLMLESSRAINREQHPTIPTNDRDRVVHIKSDEVRFPFGITAYSAHSENESYEGKSPVFWIMDEAAAFRDKGKKANGKKVYETLKSSANSRFPGLWRGLIISYPRSKTDFMMHMYDIAVAEPTMYPSRAATWEVNPTVTREDFNDDYRQDPKTARAQYECKPPGSEFGFFDEDAVGQIFIEGLPSTIRTRPSRIQGYVEDPYSGSRVSRDFVAKTLEDVVMAGGLRDRGIARIVHVDGGLTGDRAGMIVGHGVTHVVSIQDPETRKVYQQTIKKLVADALLFWQPDKEHNVPVSLNNIANIVLALRDRGMKIAAVSYDQWNSASSVEALQLAGIYCESHNITTEDYTALRYMINLGAVEIPTDQWSAWPLLQQELEQLEQIETGARFRVDHPPNGSKELADCLAGCVRLLNDPTARQHSRNRAAPRIQKMAGVNLGASSPFAGTGQMRNPGLSERYPVGSVMERSMRNTEPLGRIHRIVHGDVPEDLAHTNQKGQPVKFPRPRILRGG